jgi:hypothetical protein
VARARERRTRDAQRVVAGGTPQDARSPADVEVEDGGDGVLVLAPVDEPRRW